MSCDCGHCSGKIVHEKSCNHWKTPKQPHCSCGATRRYFEAYKATPKAITKERRYEH